MRRLKLEPEQLQNAPIELVIDKGEVAIELFGNSEVQKDVEAGHGEVVEKAQEVDEEGEGRGDSGD